MEALIYSPIENANCKVTDEDRRAFSWLWAFLCTVGHRHMLSNCPAKNPDILRHWQYDDRDPNSLATGFKVMEYMLTNLGAILDEVIGENGDKPLNARHSALFSKFGKQLFPHRHIPRRPAREQIEILLSWKSRIIHGTFWIAGYHAEGAVFVHFGKTEWEHTFDNTVMVVKALVKPFTDTTSAYKYHTPLEHHIVCTYLLPFRGQIVTCNLMTEGSPHLTPQQLEREARQVDDVVAACRNVHFSITDEMIQHVDVVATDGGCRSSVFPIEGSAPAEPGKIKIMSLIWSAGRGMKPMDQADVAAYVMRPRDDLHRGYTAFLEETWNLKDDSLCRMCSSGRRFDACCKSAHLARWEHNHCLTYATKVKQQIYTKETTYRKHGSLIARHGNAGTSPG